MLLARLAVDRKHAGQDLGGALLKHFVPKAPEVSAVVGARALLVHAQDEEAREFYLHHDFELSPIDDLTLMRLITDILDRKWGDRGRPAFGPVEGEALRCPDRPRPTPVADQRQRAP